MEEEELRLFVGGVADGRRIAVPCRIPFFLPRDLEAPQDLPAEPEKDSSNLVTYRVHYFTGIDRTWKIMAHEDLTTDDVMERLISRYTQKEEA